MKRILAALFLAALANASFAQAAKDTSEAHVANPQDCPAGTSTQAYYKWQDGRFVRDGWVCQRIPSPV